MKGGRWKMDYLMLGTFLNGPLPGSRGDRAIVLPTANTFSIHMYQLMNTLYINFICWKCQEPTWVDVRADSNAMSWCQQNNLGIDRIYHLGSLHLGHYS